MRWSAVLVLSLVLASGARPAVAWDGERDDPAGDAPVADPPFTDWVPEPMAIAPPEGVYLVTDVYAGDSVTRSGPVTTYSTETVHEITGSYARVLETVRTGDTSSLDGASFNGRASLTDGRPVAGTYYENFALTEYGFVPVSVVFFQDDSEVAQAPSPGIPPTAPTAPAAPPSIGPITTPIEQGTGPIFGYVTPSIPDGDRAVGPETPTTPPMATALPDRAIEVLRGRRISILFSGSDVRGWRVLSTDGIALGPLSGAAGQPFMIRWDRLAPPNTAWVARFALDYANGSSHDLILHVTVRAPGLVE
jgi:hypothetical protein